MNVQEYDVAIMGGGLAGLTLAFQLAKENSDLSIVVVERSKRPLQTACHKVGESSVELGSHYLESVLGLKEYLDAHHLHKNGLRFITGDGRGPIASRTEIGPAEFPIVPSFQLDRGVIETDLRRFVEEAGVVLIEGESVAEFAIDSAGEAHEVTLGGGRQFICRWLVDATGRGRLISKRLGLRRPSPQKASSAWFRVKGRVRIGDLVPAAEEEWHNRDIDNKRWLSTVHMMGVGYWVWLIPLASGYTSIGIVADEAFHSFSAFNTSARAMAWLADHETVLAHHIQDMAHEDFRAMHDYSYLAERVCDVEQRWATVGEAGVFVDPLYSMGTDFIGLANSYVTRLIVDDFGDSPSMDHVQTAAHLNDTLLLLARDAARTLSENGETFSHPDVFGAKLWWDFYNYWSFMCAHFFQSVYREDAETLGRFYEMGQAYYTLNTYAQAILWAWAGLKPTLPSAAKSFVPLPMFPSVLTDQHLALLERLAAEPTLLKMEVDLIRGRELVTEILAHALRDLGEAQAAQFGRRLTLGITKFSLDGDPELNVASWGLPTAERFKLDELPRRQRLLAVPPIARDMERALGRKKGDQPLTGLWGIASAAAAEETEAAIVSADAT